MKNRTFKIIFKLILTTGLFFLMFPNCNHYENTERMIENNIEESSYFSHALSFGSEKYHTPEDFLLTSTALIPYISSNGYCIVGDEYSLKIFSVDGDGIKRIGQRGQGPGDFEIPSPKIFLSPNNYIAVIGGKRLFDSMYTIFSPEFKFITMERLILSESIKEYIVEKTNCTNFGMRLISIWALEKDYIIYEIDLTDYETFNDYVFCYYKKGDNYKPVVLFKKPNILRYSWDKSLYIMSLDIGFSNISLLPNEKLLYYTSSEDSIVTEDEAYYIFHIVSLSTGERFEYKQIYKPTPYPDSEVLEQFFKDGYGNNYKALKNTVEEQIEYCKKRKYIPSLCWITIDGSYVFAFQKKQYRSNKIFQIKKNYDVDIFDMSTVEFIGTIQFTELYKSIKDGYMYKTGKDEYGFPIIEKYKINPAVYGK